jgi:hypothetical protein
MISHHSFRIYCDRFSEHIQYFACCFVPVLKMVTHLHLVPSSIMVELYLQFSLRLHDVAFNELSRGTTLSYLIFINSFIVSCKGILATGTNVKKFGINVLLPDVTLCPCYFIIFVCSETKKGPTDESNNIKMFRFLQP